MEPIETDERDTLSEAHESYVQRYIAFELERQERVSERFLKERTAARDRRVTLLQPASLTNL